MKTKGAGAQVSWHAEIDGPHILVAAHEKKCLKNSVTTLIGTVQKNAVMCPKIKKTNNTK